MKFINFSHICLILLISFNLCLAVSENAQAKSFLSTKIDEKTKVNEVREPIKKIAEKKLDIQETNNKVDDKH